MPRRFIATAICTICIALALVALAVLDRKHSQSRPPGFLLDMALTAADSPGEIERLVQASLAKKYSGHEVRDGYTIYPLTNGSTRWMFYQVYNAPRGLAMFNLYGYESRNSEVWRLVSYVPVNLYYYTNSDDRGLKFLIEGDYLNVVYREVVIFTRRLKPESKPPSSN